MLEYTDIDSEQILKREILLLFFLKEVSIINILNYLSSGRSAFQSKVKYISSTY